jgi:hypothetical protein
MLCILPALFKVLLGPAVLDILRASAACDGWSTADAHGAQFNNALRSTTRPADPTGPSAGAADPAAPSPAPAPSRSATPVSSASQPWAPARPASQPCRQGLSRRQPFGGAAQMPTADRLHERWVDVNRFHTTALSRAALLSGRNHHPVGRGMITETATAAPGWAVGYVFTRSPEAADLSMAAMTSWRRTAWAKSGTV